MHELEALLSRLKMEHLSYHVESLLEQAAKKELNYREFLCMALQQEWNGRHQRGMESRLKQARLPWVKTLEQFDFTFQPGIDRKVVRELAGLAFVERCENVILLGPPGVGKTHLAVALGVKAADAGHRVLFMPLDRLIATLMKAKLENRLERQLQQLSYARVLILDEIGYLPMTREEASLFQATKLPGAMGHQLMGNKPLTGFQGVALGRLPVMGMKEITSAPSTRKPATR